MQQLAHSGEQTQARERLREELQLCIEHPAIAECAVVGVNDPEWGERVSAAVELREGRSLSLDELQRWARTELAAYKVPKALETVGVLPRNAMGKVIKPEVAALFR